MNRALYAEVSREIKKAKSPYVLHRDENVAFIKGELFLKILETLPPHLQESNVLVPLETIYNVFFHKPTASLIVANKGASLLSKSILSERYFPLRHIGFLVYLPKQGIEILDVGIAGNLRKSKFVVLRPESACSPSFMFGSQRCNCYDQWLLAQELACEYNSIEKPILPPKELEHFLTSHFSLNENGELVSQSSGQAFMMIHFTSQNGMGSGVIENRFVQDLTANAFIRHRGEYTAEQIYNTSVAGGFKAIGIIPDPRKLNSSLSFKLPSIVLDYFNAPKTVVALTNNTDKLNALKNSGYDVQRLQFIARAGDGGEIEIDDRRNEFGHLIPEHIKVSWHQEFLRIKKQIDVLRKKKSLSKPDYEYTKNLTYFLKHSNEDKIDAEWFIKTLPAHFPEFEQKLKNGKPITWLDVGAGPGTKPLEIIKILSKKYNSRINFVALEPSGEWIRIFKDNLEKLGEQKKLQVKFVQSTWEDFSSEAKENFDLITFFHSVYGIAITNDIFPSLKNLTKFLQPDGRACVIVESPNSDLHFMKQQVWPELYGREPISSKTVERTLDSFGITYAVDVDEPAQKFYIGDLSRSESEERMEPLSFIAQTQPENYNRSVPANVRGKIEKHLKDKIKEDSEGSYISTPDRFIWIQK
jgi:ubiquinone/menaquinone biosynthesis C-methylase UbiE